MNNTTTNTRHCAGCFHYHSDDESWGRCTLHDHESHRKGDFPACAEYHEHRTYNDDVNMMSRTDVKGGAE